MKLDINVDDLFKDKKIESESAKLSYLGLVTENLRSNNKKVVRNSFWLILSILLYLLTYYEEASLQATSILFFNLKNRLLVLNLIPVFFAFIYFQNVTLWNNNINLRFIFDSLVSDVYGLSRTHDTINIVKPFSLLNHVINYQYNNKKIKSFLKFPLTIIFLVITLAPMLLIIASVYMTAILNTFSFIPVFCGVLTSVIGFSTILQALSNNKD